MSLHHDVNPPRRYSRGEPWPPADQHSVPRIFDRCEDETGQRETPVVRLADKVAWAIVVFVLSAIGIACWLGLRA